MASPQPTDSHTRISNELYTQILMRDFTKRQRAILDLLIRLSYGCGKKTAHIPQMKHFETCGVSPNKVKGELEALRVRRVIDWDIHSHDFWLNKDYDTWELPMPNEEQQEMFAELLRINLKVVDAQNGKSNAQNGHDQNGQDDQKGKSQPPKTGSENLPKREVEEPAKPSGTRADEPPITKDNYKDISKEEVVVEPPKSPTDLVGEIEGLLQSKMVNQWYKLIREDYKIFHELLADEVSRESIIQGVEWAFERFKPKHSRDAIKSFSYCIGFIYEAHEIDKAAKEVASARDSPSGIDVKFSVQQRSRASPGRVGYAEPHDERYDAFYKLFPDVKR